ncbi:MAG: LXG domain-containing protein [Lachnospiraceae bacterium]|nr:LXG domain-containing protein [Lachnospiraceae bacterium]
MASKGNLYLSNQSVRNLYEAAASYGTTVQSALYSQYQNAFKISVSNYLRGDAADAFKNYISRGAINIITEFLDIVSDVTMVGELIAEAFYQYECTTGGKVEEPTLDYINQTLNSRETTFNGAKGELNSAISAAARYISVQPLSLQTVNSAYTATRNSVKKIREDMYSVDDSALQTANELMDRINALHDYIDKLMAFCYSDDGRINADNLSTIQDQDWFYEAGNITLYLLLEEDPFVYCAGEVTLAEDQWAAGLCSDVYAYAGYSYMSASGEAGIEDGTAFAKGAAAVLSANGYAQFTDYLNASAEVNVDYVEGEVKVGWSDNYKGFKVSAGVGGVAAEGKVVIGSEDFNAYVK